MRRRSGRGALGAHLQRRLATICQGGREQTGIAWLRPCYGGRPRHDRRAESFAAGLAEHHQWSQGRRHDEMASMVSRRRLSNADPFHVLLPQHGESSISSGRAGLRATEWLDCCGDEATSSRGGAWETPPGTVAVPVSSPSQTSVVLRSSHAKELEEQRPIDEPNPRCVVRCCCFSSGLCAGSAAWVQVQGSIHDPSRALTVFLCLRGPCRFLRLLAWRGGSTVNLPPQSRSRRDWGRG